MMRKLNNIELAEENETIETWIEGEELSCKPAGFSPKSVSILLLPIIC